MSRFSLLSPSSLLQFGGLGRGEGLGRFPFLEYLAFPVLVWTLIWILMGVGRGVLIVGVERHREGGEIEESGYGRSNEVVKCNTT